ncbi:MAG: hypothetical protein WED87_04920, partial [Dehalococcoidia bacterium]
GAPAAIDEHLLFAGDYDMARAAAVRTGQGAARAEEDDFEAFGHGRLLQMVRKSSGHGQNPYPRLLGL